MDAAKRGTFTTPCVSSSLFSVKQDAFYLIRVRLDVCTLDPFQIKTPQMWNQAIHTPSPPHKGLE